MCQRGLFVENVEKVMYENIWQGNTKHRKWSVEIRLAVLENAQLSLQQCWMLKWIYVSEPRQRWEGLKKQNGLSGIEFAKIPDYWNPAENLFCLLLKKLKKDFGITGTSMSANQHAMRQNLRFFFSFSVCSTAGKCLAALNEFHN